MADKLELNIDDNIKSIYSRSFPALQKEIGFYRSRNMDEDVQKTEEYMRNLAEDIGMSIPESIKYQSGFDIGVEWKEGLIFPFRITYE